MDSTAERADAMRWLSSFQGQISPLTWPLCREAQSVLYVRRGHLSGHLHRFSFDCGWTLTALGVSKRRAHALALRLHARVHQSCAGALASLDRADAGARSEDASATRVFAANDSELNRVSVAIREITVHLLGVSRGGLSATERVA